MTEKTVCDIVVVGGGIAGLTAALSAHQAGATVVLLEKLDSVGGSSAMSGGFIAFSGTDEQHQREVSDSTELFRADLLALGGGAADTRLVDAYLANQHDTYRWLKANGVEFDDVEISSGQSAIRSHHTDIRSVLGLFADRFVEAGGTLLLGCAARSLSTDANGAVIGVVAERNGQRTELVASAGVVLASGGFSRGVDLLQTFAPAQLKAIPYGGLGNTGDGLKMAWRLGAGMADMGYITGTYGSHPDTGPEFHELLTAYYMGAIIVNERGERFVDESRSYKVLGRECLKQPRGLGFEVFDRRVRAKSHAIPLSDIEMLENIGHVFKADTLAELARCAGIDEAGLLATVASYNASARGETADSFGRTSLVNGVGDLLTVEEGPFYAYPAKTLMTTTYCGLTITPDAEVRRVDGSLIPGLYAIGEVTGGFHGEAYMTGTSLGKGAVFGRIAARQLTKSLVGS
ncbi:FAD-dependent oxidoreductase [Rhodococcus sp. NCIMB 12038]|uniref:FAD-dependent oxidoreductase n=1 Tax=Rhodococcus sp. NCIMB 12038 TaxID=933800 RepID=UPI000B3C1428|nr:FAD-dependent oxidoreductase [Rhodococcus sp. NCIMB 12038]OUS91354.1 reductase flavoprotein subunit [Rhodococcus sp. NCIMB 12038]